MRLRFAIAAFVLAAAAILLRADPAPAQFANVVTACPPIRATPYPAGTQGLLTIDVNGNLCATVASSGSGSAVTIADGADVSQGAAADTACATDNGTCSAIALLKRENQRLTSLLTALGAPFQAAGSIGNTSFAATQATAASLNATVVGTGTFATQAAVTAASGAFASGSQPIGITPTDRTVTSATGSSQTVMSASATRKSLTIVNTGNANCGVNPTGGTAAIGGAGTLTLAPLGSYTPRVPTLSAVTAICTAAQPLYADES